MARYIRNEVTTGAVEQAPRMSELMQGELFQYQNATNNGVYMRGNVSIIHLQTGQVYPNPDWTSRIVRIPQLTIKTVIE